MKIRAFLVISASIFGLYATAAPVEKSKIRTKVEIKFLSLLPIKIADARNPAYTTLLKKDGKLNITFGQGNFIRGWGSWSIKGNQLTVTEFMQQVTDPETEKPVKKVSSKSILTYELGLDSKDNLLIAKQARDKEGNWYLPVQ